MKKIFVSLSVLFFIVFHAFSQEAKFDAINYQIHIDSININTKSLHAKTLIKLKPLSNNVNTVTFDLLNMNINYVKENNVENSNYTSDSSSITINLANDYAQDEEFLIEISYFGIPYSEDWGGVIFNGEYVYNLGVGINTIPHNLGKAWFPCFDNFTDKATFEYFITVPNNKVATCGGILIDITENDNGTTTYYYKSNFEISTYLASFAIGEYEVIEDSYTSIDGSEIPITFTVKPSAVNAVPLMFSNLKTILNIFETHFGPYTFERVGYTGTSIGAMEHQNNISFPNMCIVPSLEYEPLYAHELSHSWFGNKITCETAFDMWINEGWASFCEYFFKEKLYNRKSYMNDILSAKSAVLNSAHGNISGGGDGGYVALNNLPLEATYGISAYKRGALVAHSLRSYLGDDVFFDAIKEVFDNYSFQTFNSQKLCDALSEASNVDLSYFFTNYVFTPGVAGYIIDSCVINNSVAKIYVQQKGLGRSEIVNPTYVDVTLFDENFNRQDAKINITGKYGSGEINLDIEEPIATILNFENLYYDAKLNDSKVISKANSSYYFSKMNFDVEVETLTDSALVYVSKSYVGCDNNNLVPDNSEISESSFWQVYFIPYNKESFNCVANGIFYYDKYSIDSTFLNSREDKQIILLYRNKPGEIWQKIDATLYGDNESGIIYAKNIKSGEYALAFEESSGIDNSNKKEKLLNIYPNPTKNSFEIKFNASQSNKKLIIYTVDGFKVFETVLLPNQNSFIWSPNNKKNQTYIFNLIAEDGNIVSSKGVFFHK
ncbi:MAG: M1 family aminopeptidase [Bacteroidales bacterium]|jgi:hypothetical protein